MRQAGCYCIICEDGYSNGFTCNYCVNLLILLKNAIIDDKNILVQENWELRSCRDGLTAKDISNTVPKD